MLDHSRSCWLTLWMRTLWDFCVFVLFIPPTLVLCFLSSLRWTVGGIRGLTTIASMTYFSAGLPPMGKRPSFQAIICHQLLSGRFLVLRNAASIRKRLGSGVSGRRTPPGKAANELSEWSSFSMLEFFWRWISDEPSRSECLLGSMCAWSESRTTICERFTL